MTKQLDVPAVDESPGMCGPSSLRQVLAYYGVRKSEAELARLCGADPVDGTPPGEIARVAKQLGFDARVEVGCTLADLEEWLESGAPVIVDWDPHDEGVERGSHYSTVVQVTATQVRVQDPEPARIKTLTRKAFEEKWIRGRAIVVERRGGLRKWAGRKVG
jgi:ABC-type bacteriocin/lantibiotic exporter with double-glycine peptidase domain